MFYHECHANKMRKQEYFSQNKIKYKKFFEMKYKKPTDMFSVYTVEPA